MKICRTQLRLFGLAILTFSLTLTSHAASLKTVKDILDAIPFTATQNDVRKVLGEPVSKEFDLWQYYFTNDSFVKEVSLIWDRDHGKVKMRTLSIIPSHPIDPSSLVDANAKGDEIHSPSGDTTLPEVAFRIPSRGLRLELNHSKKVVALCRMVP